VSSPLQEEEEPILRNLKNKNMKNAYDLSFKQEGLNTAPQKSKKSTYRANRVAVSKDSGQI